MERLVSHMVATALLAMLLQACLPGPGFFRQSESSLSQLNSATASIEISVDDGVTSGIFDPSANLSQRMEAAPETAIAGSSVELAPGAIGIATTVSMEEGSDISQSIFSALELENSVSQSGTAVAIASSVETNTATPMTLAIPAPGGASLLQTDDSLLVVLFQRYDAELKQMYFGVLPREKISVLNGIVSFQTKQFGIYQAAYVEKKITNTVEKKTEEKLVTKRDEQKLQISAETFIRGDVTYDSVTVTWTANGIDPDEWSIAIDAGKDPASCLQPNQVKLRGVKRDFTAHDLEADTEYHFAICALQGGKVVGNELRTKGRTSSPVTNLPEVTGLTTDVLSSFHMDLLWGAPSTNQAISRYLVSYLSSPANATDYPPKHCGGHQEESMMENFYWLSGFAAQSLVNIRVCVEYADGSVSEGATASTTTASHSITCDSGDLDGTCTINSTKAIPSGVEWITGQGSINITATGELTAAGNNRKIIFFLAGDITCSRVTSDCIDLSGNGEPGGTSLVGAGGNSGGYYSRNVFPTGGSHAGEGGIDADFERPPAPRGSFVHPVDFGAAGGSNGTGTSGSGGGILELHVRNILMDGVIRADGTAATGIAGGGAGGSIVVRAETINNNGGSLAFSASGGDGGTQGGGGGGGRISLMADTITGTSYYTGGGNGDTDDADGGAGTVYTEEFTAGSNPAQLTFSTVLLSRPSPSILCNARATFDPMDIFGSLDLLTVNTQVFVLQEHNDPNNNHIIKNISLTSSGHLNANGRGFQGGIPGQNGQNNAFGGIYNASHGGSGGANQGSGGLGGDGIATAAGDSSYFGPGGGGGASTWHPGGDGGGVIKLKASQNIDFQAGSKATAYGLKGFDCVGLNEKAGGGGAGGYIDLTAATFTGSGEVYAKGGFGGNCSQSGGKGGGGGGGGAIKITGDMTGWSPNILINAGGGGTGNPTDGATGATGADGNIY